MDRFDKELNNTQIEAVKSTEGPVLVLAGAGTGKTRVIIYRIAYLIEVLGVAPWRILAVTFTNKAAGEMKSRLLALAGQNARQVNMGTFHSICLSILRRDGYKIGLPAFFSIVDQEDRLNLVRVAIKTFNLDVKQYPPKQYLHAISTFKNSFGFINSAQPQSTLKNFKEVYKVYNQLLQDQHLIDFDDMLGLTVRLFMTDQDTLNEYKETYKYILVDEYQDTNAVQFQLLYLLAGETGNLCVVGDDDQSIYGWRGAELSNILNFDKFFLNVKEIKLTGNYRSGQKILDAANSLISNNIARRGKMLEANRNMAGKVIYKVLQDEAHEANYVVGLITETSKNDGTDLSEVVILYRTNAQSRNFEVALNRAGIAYKVIGGIGFYQRREIKDILSYLRFFDNKFDGAAFHRSIKNPSRGLGDASIDKIINYATKTGKDIFETLKNSYDTFPVAKRPFLESYINVIEGIGEQKSLKDKIDFIVRKTGYEEYLKQFEEPDEASRRIDNVMELYSAAAAFEEQNQLSSLSDFLADTVLVTVEDEKVSGGVVKLMSIHAAKGLEFEIVFLTGLEEGLFPLASAENEGNLEEERRLCYVGFTRAKDKLYLTSVDKRMLYGRRQVSPPSKFLQEAGISDESSKNDTQIKNNGFSHNFKYNEKSQDAPKALFPVSTKVTHKVFGNGIVTGSEGTGALEKVTVLFKTSGVKKILAGFLTKRD